MSIQSVIHSLYAIMCEAQMVVAGDGSKQRLLHLISKIRDEDVNEAMDSVDYMLKELSEINENFRKMYILHYTTGTDKENKNVVIETECVWGNKTIKFSTLFDEKAAKSIIEALSMSLKMVQAGDRLSEGGRA